MVGLYYLTIEKDKIDEFRKEYDTKIFPEGMLLFGANPWNRNP